MANGDGSKGQALAVREQGADLRTDRAAFEPATMADAFDLASKLAKSGLMPSSLRSPEAIVTAVIMGRELGLTAMQSVRSIHVIEGKPTLSSALIVALVKKSPVCRYFRMVESTDERATYETLREGDPEPTRMSFTIQQARNAGVTGKGNWKSYPAAMLRARCETALARAVYPDLVMGLYDPDELEPARPERDVTPAPRTVAAVVVEQPSAAQPEDVDPATGEVVAAPAERALAERIQAAASQAELKAIGADVGAAHKGGQIDDLARARLLVVYGERWKAVPATVAA